MHVVHIISGLGQGGAETVLYRLLSNPMQGCRHTVISLTDEGVFGARLRAAGVEVQALRMPAGRLTLKGLRQLFTSLRTLKPDVVQTWMYHADLIGGVVARLAGIRAVAWGIRNSGENLHKSSRMTRIVAWACARLSSLVPATVISCSHDAAKRHLSWGYRAGRMVVIPNGYDLSQWQPDAAARIRFRSQWGLSSHTAVVGSVARWNPLKDHANLLSAFARLKSVRPDIRCVLIGRGMQAENAGLMTLIESLDLRDSVILLGERDDVPAIMNAFDVHVLSSCAEGFPNVVAEAMATEVPNVVTDVGDAALIVQGDGWIVPSQNAQALGQAMGLALDALGTDALREKTQRGRKRVGKQYSLPAMVAAYREVWVGLAHETRSPKNQGYVQDTPGVTAPGARLEQSSSAAMAQPDPGVTRQAQRRRVLMVVNNPAFFLSHRLAVAQGARAAGFDVHVATMDGPSVEIIKGHGLSHHVIPMSRSGKNPLQELHTLFSMWRLFRRLRPAIVHSVTIKPVLYGGIAARLAGVPAYVAAISGLGFLFTRPRRSVDVLRISATFLYRLALGHRNSSVIFQNSSDRDVLLDAGAVTQSQGVLIRGSGVDLDVFQAVPEPPGAPVAIMVSRLLTDKGVREFVEAAELAARRSGGMRWQLAGSPDEGNPASIGAAELKRWCEQGIIEYLGEQSDVPALYQHAHIAVLPSYREGLPKSLIEAAACARAVVTTDVPGCRDAIEPGVSGLLVPPRDAQALSLAVQRLADDGALRRQMGQAGRVLAEQAFDIRQIVGRHIEVYDRLLERLHR